MCQLGYSHEDDGIFFCRGCNKPMCQLGYSHEDDGTFFCRGCNKPMCQLGYSHEDDGTFFCRGCNKPMCQLGYSHESYDDDNPAPKLNYFNSNNDYSTNIKIMDSLCVKVVKNQCVY